MSDSATDDLLAKSKLLRQRMEVKKNARTATDSLDSSPQEILSLLNEGKLDIDHTIFLEDITYSPAKKCGWLVIGVLLVVMILPMALGLYIIWQILKLGPLWSTTRHITCRAYLGSNHGILEYEYKNARLVEAEFVKLDANAYVSIVSVPLGDHGSTDVFALHYGNSKFKELWSTAGRIKGNYQNVKEFSEISGVKIDISPSKKKRHKLDDLR